MSVFLRRRDGKIRPDFDLLRFFSITSFIAVVVAAILLALLCRQFVIPQTIQQTETTTETVAQTLLDSLRPDLADYLASLYPDGLRASIDTEPSPQLAARLRQILRDTAIAKIKILNRDGDIVYTLERGQSADNRSAAGTGLVIADSRHAGSKFVRRGPPTSFEPEEPEHDNLIEGYVPVRATATGPVQGMLEIYTDIDHIVSHNNQTVVLFLVGVLIILGGQFMVLVLAARRARHIVETERRAGNARTADLETLAVELLNSEDAEKKKIATDLHEELAQTLSAIKVNLELGRERIASGKGNAGALQSTVPALQEALQLVRSLAMRLWPFSLDDLGLLSTISGFCDEFERLHPAIRVDQDMSLNEQDVPRPLKIVIYRIVESALRNFVRYGDAESVTLSLHAGQETITLEIEAIATQTSYGAAARKSADPTLNARFSTIQERVTLSGGTFAVQRSDLGVVTLAAMWKK